MNKNFDLVDKNKALNKKIKNNSQKFDHLIDKKKI